MITIDILKMKLVCLVLYFFHIVYAKKFVKIDPDGLVLIHNEAQLILADILLS